MKMKQSSKTIEKSPSFKETAPISSLEKKPMLILSTLTTTLPCIVVSFSSSQVLPAEQSPTHQEQSCQNLPLSLAHSADTVYLVSQASMVPSLRV